jgi:hypothetical protein
MPMLDEYSSVFLAFFLPSRIYSSHEGPKLKKQNIDQQPKFIGVGIGIGIGYLKLDPDADSDPDPESGFYTTDC